MEDLISRQAVNILVDELARAISDERCCMSRGRSTASIMQDILDLPSVQQEPKTGHWIERNDDHNDWIECSECEYGAEGEITSESGVRFRYCPICGAKMESEEEE